VLDLKAKLAAAGVVTDDQVRRLEENEARKRQAKKTRRPAPKRGPVDVEGLRAVNKGEAYLQIRRLVQKHRRDAAENIVPSADATTFSFVDASGRLRQLLLEPDVHRAVVEGKAAISAYMSNNGLAHCVLPRGIALDLAKVFPLWLRKLTGHPEAGKVEREDATKAGLREGATDAPTPDSTDESANEAANPPPALPPPIG
jgi:hypothetical protein